MKRDSLEFENCVFHVFVIGGGIHDCAESYLISSGEGEGFGLPLIRTAQYGIPIVTRDIPVIKEISKEYAYYFHDSIKPDTIATAIKSRLMLYKKQSSKVK